MAEFQNCYELEAAVSFLVLPFFKVSIAIMLCHPNVLGCVGENNYPLSTGFTGFGIKKNGTQWAGSDEPHHGGFR